MIVNEYSNTFQCNAKVTLTYPNLISNTLLTIYPCNCLIIIIKLNIVIPHDIKNMIILTILVSRKSLEQSNYTLPKLKLKS